MKKNLLFFLLMSLTVCASAETDTVRVFGLDEVTVSGTQIKVSSDAFRVVSVISRDEIAAMPVTSVSDLLDYLPGVDVRSRGVNGVQADISMRGGTFDQVLVMLNGVNLTDPHTGHHTLNLPIDLSMVDRIEVLQGTSISAFGLSAFSGAINIVTGNGNASEVKAVVEGGDHGYFMPSVGAHQNVGNWKLTAAASYNQSTGYMENTDYKYGNIFLQARYANRRTGNFNIQLGGQLKGFGSNAFYSLKYPDQYEATKMLSGAVTWDYDFDFPLHIEASLFTRAHYDRFELFREGVVEFPSWYTTHNYHVSNVSGANAKLSWLEKWGKTTVGLEVRNENILSNVLGDSLTSTHYIPYTHKEKQFSVGKNRFNVNYFAEQSFYYNDFSASIGVAGNYNTMFRNNFSFGANLGYHFAAQGDVFFNASRSLRLPTFTDLYYKSATQIANPELKPESSINLELGVRYATHGFHTSLNAYYRFGRNIIDWVKAPAEEQWRSMNHTAVDAVGGELAVGYHAGYWLKNIDLTYAFCHLNKDAGELISKYALDYLRHKLTLSLGHGIWRGFGAEWQLTLQSRNGEYTDVNGDVVAYKPVLLLDGKIYWQHKNINIYASATNLTNRHYYDYGGILQPGIWAKAGIAVTINTDKK
ncbi:MAG: TonB-dependent receptor [Bacteroidales bacterium]|nr:TonB-dependent receptor [Bacteroidales bacterium]